MSVYTNSALTTFMMSVLGLFKKVFDQTFKLIA